jgi:hypothetical protein
MLLVAFVALDPDSSPPTPADVASAWQQTWPEEAPLAEVQGDDGALTLSFMDAFGMVGYIPQPLPWSDLEGPARCAWHWPEAVDILEQHAGHVIVSVRTTDESSIRCAIRLTLLTAAICVAMKKASAVYWPSGTCVSSAATFVELARAMSPESFPLLAWVEFRVFSNNDGSRWSVFTTGLQPLGLMEIEVRDAAGNPAELVEKVMDIAGYLTQAGLVLGDGDTVGASDDEKLHIHHVPSAWEREGNVLWVEV